jgi:NAD(P)-dependent dehydrogenase (short-subunit alcohol dehydrogenase family)
MDLPYTIDLTGKVAAVTGGTGILCGEMARALAACGAQVAVLSRREDAVERTAAAIREAGGTAIGVPCDVLDRDALAAANAVIEQNFGAVDILINGAGGNHPKGTTSTETFQPAALADPEQTSFYDLDLEGFRFVFDLNLLGTLLATQAFTRSMAERGGGCVINVSSMSAFAPLTKVCAYSSAKAAVNNFTQWLAVHMAPAGVRVNALAPGFFLTEQNRDLLTEADGSFTERGNKIVSQTPMGRLGEAHELIGALLWLASDAAAGFVTGTVIPVDGGFAAYSGV